MNGFSFLAIPILLLLKANLYEAQSPIKTINIAAGKPITATATCGVGVSEPELYCKLASVPGKFGIKGLECDRCIPDSYSKDHAIKYAVDGSEKWWQSPPLSRGLSYQRVNITINLKRAYQVAYVVIKTGNAPRPGVWSLERSVDDGRTFTPWQHFATSPSECRRYFGIETLLALTRDDSVKCSTEYSSIPPFENGEIHISLVTGRPGAANFSYSPTLQEWTRASHIRLRLMKVKTLLTDLLPLAREDPTVTRRYFYSIKDISVGAICMCNGHADQCLESQRGSAVEFVCRCKHNTCGSRCEKCCPSFVQKKWRPGLPTMSNECEACNCHQHSSECYYDPLVAQSRRSLDLNNRYEGGGVCVNCQHNTAGINCERCKEGYYNPTGIPKTSRGACRSCNCDPKYSTGRCYDGSGDCECKSKYGGARCDRCSEGFYGFPDCRPCDCNPSGTTGRVCGPTGNQCPCKPNFSGNKCDRCAAGYYGYPQCQRCNCDNFGAYDSYCDPTNGQCRCRQTYRSRQCNQCNRGFYSFPECKPCNCDSEGTAPGICDPVFGRCICLKNFAGARCDQCNEGYYRFPECIGCGCSREGSVTPRCNARGACTCKDNYIGAKCENCKLGYYNYPRCIKCACDPRGAVHEICDLNTGQCTCKDDNRGLNCNQCRAGYYGFPNCRRCSCNPAGSKPIVGRPYWDCSYSNNGQCDCKDNVQGLICGECKSGFHNLSASNPRGCDACYCDLAGVVAGLSNCDDGNGQCTCKQHVTGMRCNTCKVGYFGLEAKREFGCSGCNCDVGGSYDQVCDAKTGQCKCRPNVEGLDCSRPIKDYYYPDLFHVKAEVEDGCVPAPANGVQGRDVPGRLLQSDPARQGDDTGNCNPVRYGFDEAVYPGFSWKGYVGFNALQKEIKVTLEVPKTGRYHVVFNYALNDSNPVRGEISLSPRGQGSKQSSSVTFGSTQVGSTYVSGFTTAGEPAQPSQFMLTRGTWDLTFKAPPSKLLVDYISAIPQEYYQAYILERKVTNPCIVNSQDPLCVQYSYINTIRPDFPTVELETGYIITRQGRQQTHVFDDKRVLEQLDFNAMAYLDRTQTRVTEDVNLPKAGDYVLVMQYYHPSDQTKTLDVYLRSRRSQQKGTFYLHSCRFRFGCRQVALDKDRRLKIFKANEIERRVITLLIDSDTSVAVDSITAIPREQWNLDYVVPRPLCTTKNNKCISTSYPVPKGAVQYDVAADGSKPPPNILNPKTTLKYLEGETTYSVIYNNLRTGKYAVVVHYYQPKHVTFRSDTTVTSDQVIMGDVQLDYCPNVEGCRAVVRAFKRDDKSVSTTSFDIGRPSGEFRMTVPRGSSAWIDYVLFIPQDRFSQEVADPNPVSFSKDFIVDCAKDSFFIKPSASSVCTKPVFSLATAFNNGTFPCECDVQGAVDSECRKFGGQCRCKQNVIGRKCNRCKTGYYGFPNCYKCQCVFCNEVTGACDCPTNTVGRNCELCLKGTYGYDPILGCQDCKCDVSGVIGGDVACDPVTGTCPCKPSHTGRRCNQCTPGRYGYPYCDKCDCDKRGVVSDVCDAKGTCLCKAGVLGRRCDTCASGFYNLDAKNPNGCTSCWCSGLSKICSSSILKRFNIRQMDGWRIENTPAQVIKSALTTVMVSVAGKRTNPDRPIYWLAPEEYSGKQIFSYGGSLTYLLRYTTPVEVTNPALTVHPDVIIKGKNGVEMTYKNQMMLQPNTVHKILAHFNESLWSVANNSRSSRADLMSILADIESVRLRASYSTAVADTSISDVLLESALESSVGEIAKEVERCVCPPKASGTSCELCGKGYTRGADNRTCVRCQCNGHSSDCHPETGECYNCLHNTAGDRCQTCVKGYYGNGTTGTPNDCQLCKCPLGTSSNSFASECALDKNGQLTCVCNKGYTGLQCDQCADGYYGDPTITGDYCKPCKCNGNIDPQVPGSCDPFTGVCTKCINKASGDNCERCRDGYYGDAVVAKNCQKCQCSACGAMTSLCNYNSGACLCKKNVMGEQCDTCKVNTWNFESCLGCEDCNCGNASLGASCNVKTGQCICKPGAIGRRCERCQAGFWNYKPEGCQACNCPKGADNLWGFCDVNTGQCCKPGGNCTICPPNYILTPSGCEFCGECVGRLLDVAQGLDKNITTVLEYLKKGAAGVIAQAKYKDLNDTLNKLIPPTNKYTHTMESVSVIVGISVVNGTANPRPLARYPLAKRTRGKDISNRGLVDAQFSNTAWVAGPDGPESAVQLQGNENSFIRLENNGKLHSKRSSSILLWVKHEGREGPIMYFGYNKLRIWLDEFDAFEACFTDAQKPNCRKSQSTPTSKWVHLAMVYDYEAGMTEFWVDEQLADRTPLASKSALATDSKEVWMGAVPKVDAFSGALACLQIFDQPLDVQQISVLKKACHPDFVQPVPGPDKSLLERTSESESKTNTMKEQASMVHKDAKESSKNATKTKADALILEQDIRDALNRSRSIINLSGSIVEKLQTGSENQTMLLEEAERILKELQNRDFTALNNTVNQELSFIESVSDNAKMLLNETLGLHNEARRARELIAKLKGEFNGLLDKVIGILKNVSMAEQWNDKSKKFDSMTPIMKAQAKKERMESSLKMVQEILGKASSSLTNATRNFENFSGSFARLDDLIRQVYDRFKNLTMATDMLRPLAAKASNHSEVLRKQAKILEDLLTDTQQFAEKAINASKAYSNIAKKLNEALVIARQAEGNATEAEEKSKAVNARAKVTNAESQNIANSSSSVKDRVDNHLQKLLDELKDRIAQLKKKIMSVEDDLGMIDNTFDDIDKYGDMGTRAKSAQQNATDSEMMADDAYRIALDIESQLPGLKNLKDSIVAANINVTVAEKQIMDAVNKSMHIKERIQIVHINQTRILNDLKKDVLDVIQEIQDMLSDSRELLNKMSVVMNFGNDTISNPLAPPVSRDFSMVKDIELFIKPRVTDALLLYLGPTLNIKKKQKRQADQTSCENDFVSLELKAARVQAVACVSGKLITLVSTEEIEIVPEGRTTTVKPPPDQLAKPVLDPWFKIHFNISGDTAMLDFEYYESNKKPIKKIVPRVATIDVPNPILRIDKDNNFLLVGGIPSGVKVPSNINMKRFNGPMDGLRIDFLPVGLWNAEKLVSPTVFYDRLAFRPKQELNTYRFNGNGYLKVGYYTTYQTSRVSFTFKTTESRGLLMLAVRDIRKKDDKTSEIFMMMDIVNSTFRLMYNQGGGIRTLMASTPCDDGRDHMVSLMEDPDTRQHFTLKFDSEVLANRKRYYDTRGADLVTAEYIYFGGIERGPRIPVGMWGPPKPVGVDIDKIVDFSGCISNPTIATALKEQITSVGFERTCFPRPVRYLTLLAPDSYLIMDGLAIDDRSFTLGISFRTRQKTGIFLHQAHQTMDFFTLGMIGGRVILSADTGEGSFKTIQTDLDNYDDGSWYHVSVVKNGPEISLHVGYENKKARFNPRYQSIQTGSRPLYVGGIPKNYEAKNQKVFFRGVKFNLAGTTLRDLVFKGEIVNFLNYQNKLKVIFDEEDFPLPRPRDLIIPKIPTTSPLDHPTDKPITTEPTTMEPTTAEMIMTMEPTTMEPTTMEPTTMEPTTMEPTTMEPTTMEPTTMEPTTMEPTTMEPTTMEPTTLEATIMATTPTKSTGCVSGPPIVKDNTINSFSDDPNSYAKYTQIKKDPVMRKVVGSRTKISLEFRTLGQDGIIFYSANGERQSDFLACFLLSGKVKCRFSAGSGIGDLVSTKTYNDQKWHTLLFNRKLKVGTLKINNEKVATVTSTGGSTNVDGLVDFYLGGVPKGYNSKRIEERQAAMSFPGCIRNFMVSAKDPGAAGDVSGVVGCVTSDVESGSFFNGGFIKLVETFRVGLKKTVMLEIKPRVDTAAIFSTINKGGDYLVLELLKGDLILRVENGNGPFEVRYSPSNKKELCDGQWHRIRIVKERNTASLVVDSNDPIKVQGKGSLSNTDVKDPLYVGGVPDGFTHKALKTTARYKGCIRGFLDGNKQVPISSPVEKTGELFLNGCPTILP